MRNLVRVPRRRAAVKDLGFVAGRLLFPPACGIEVRRSCHNQALFLQLRPESQDPSSTDPKIDGVFWPPFEDPAAPFPKRLLLSASVNTRHRPAEVAAIDSPPHKRQGSLR